MNWSLSNLSTECIDYVLNNNASYKLKLLKIYQTIHTQKQSFS